MRYMYIHIFGIVFLFSHSWLSSWLSATVLLLRHALDGWNNLVLVISSKHHRLDYVVRHQRSNIAFLLLSIFVPSLAFEECREGVVLGGILVQTWRALHLLPYWPGMCWNTSVLWRIRWGSSLPHRAVDPSIPRCCGWVWPSTFPWSRSLSVFVNGVK